MSTFTKLFGVAKKALDAKNAPAGGSAAGQTDWRSMVRSAADAITGDGRTAAPVASPPAPPEAPAGSRRQSAQRGPSVSNAPIAPEDRAAIARYDYLLQTADPAQIEEVHREAFARLNPAQREQIEQRMRVELSAHEQPRSAGADDLARAATRAEASRPGLLTGLLARVGGGPGAGAAGAGATGGSSVGRNAMIGGAVGGTALAAGGILGAVAGGAILSSVAGPLLEQAAGLGVDFDALGGALDLESLAGGFEGLDGLASGAGETVTGLGDQISGFGDQVGEIGSGWSLPGLDDLLGR